MNPPEGLQLIRVMPETLPYGWTQLYNLLEPAIVRSRGECSKDSVYENCLSESQQMWAAVKDEEVVGAMVTHIIEHEEGMRTCEILLLGGVHMAEWIEFWHQIEDWALVQGCSRVKAYVRPGMIRHLRPYGFEETHRVVIKSLRGKMQ